MVSLQDLPALYIELDGQLSSVMENMGVISAQSAFNQSIILR